MYEAFVEEVLVRFASVRHYADWVLEQERLSWTHLGQIVLERPILVALLVSMVVLAAVVSRSLSLILAMVLSPLIVLLILAQSYENQTLIVSLGCMLQLQLLVCAFSFRRTMERLRDEAFHLERDKASLQERLDREINWRTAAQEYPASAVLNEQGNGP
ncbi:hypothetical protein [Sedimentitalea sp.]|uniref:hypothetical protein n=1 Tax=Sedimentitalea sp. TaxID=2048915 RepID=UPI0032986089